MEFQRFTAPDPAALEASIAEKRAGLVAAQQAGDGLAIVDHTADLGALLTTARREAEALPLLQAQLDRVEAFAGTEVAGWFWHAYATALQYNDRREEANAAFTQALALSRAGGWQRLQAFVLQHWGRSLVEQGRLDDAQARFEEALALRRQLGDPRASTTEGALAGLAELRQQQALALRQGSCHCGAVRLTLPTLPDKATKCNCSICRRTGGLWAFYEFGSVQIEGHPEHTTGYVWGDKTLRTLRCAHCGCVTHWEPLPPEAGAPVSLDAGRPWHLKLSPVAGFTSQALESWAKAHLQPGTRVPSDGLSCFTAVTAAGCLDEAVVVGHHLPRELPQFHWGGTVLGNLKTALAGTHHAFDFATYAASYLTGFAYRFNWRFDLRALTAHLIVDVARCQPRVRHVIRGNAEIGCESGRKGWEYSQAGWGLELRGLNTGNVLVVRLRKKRWFARFQVRALISQGLLHCGIGVVCAY